MKEGAVLVPPHLQPRTGLGTREPGHGVPGIKGGDSRSQACRGAGEPSPGQLMFCSSPAGGNGTVGGNRPTLAVWTDQQLAPLFIPAETASPSPEPGGGL